MLLLGVPERERKSEEMFEEIMAEIWWNINLHIRETQWFQVESAQREKPRHIIIKLVIVK